MLGIFSPSVSLKTDLQTSNTYGYSILPMHLDITLLNTAEARGARGGAGNRNVNRNRNVNVNRNVNRSRNVNVNHNNRYYGGGYGHVNYGYYGGRAIVAWSSAVAVGSIIAAASMPTTCTTFVTNGISYKQCGASYYRPYYQGTTVVYKVVNSPY